MNHLYQRAPQAPNIREPSIPILLHHLRRHPVARPLERVELLPVHAFHDLFGFTKISQLAKSLIHENICRLDISVHNLF